MALTLSICGASVYGYAHYRRVPIAPLQPLYIEITAIDDGGHPVAGSQIHIEKTQRGVTDSFGEWRGIVQTHPGTTLALSIQKRRGKNRLQANRLLQVPLELSDSSELKTTIQLSRNQRESPTRRKVAGDEG